MSPARLRRLSNRLNPAGAPPPPFRLVPIAPWPNPVRSRSGPEPRRGSRPDPGRPRPGGRRRPPTPAPNRAAPQAAPGPAAPGCKRPARSTRGRRRPGRDRGSRPRPPASVPWSNRKPACGFRRPRSWLPTPPAGHGRSHATWRACATAVSVGAANAFPDPGQRGSSSCAIAPGRFRTA